METLQGVAPLLWLLAVLGGLVIGLIVAITRVRSVKLRQKPPKLATWPYVTVLLPAYNEEKVIARCLESILEQEYPHFEVVVIAGGEDRTFEIAQQYAGEQVRVIRQPRRGKAYALNLGLKEARGEVVVTVDADCLFPKEWLKKIVAPLVLEPDLSAVGGWSRPTNPRGVLVACQYAQEVYETVLQQKTPVILPGFASAFRACALREVGGFNERVYMLIDYEMQLRLAQKGFKFARNVDAFLYREFASYLRDYVRQQLRWVRGMLRLSLKYKPVPFSAKLRAVVRPVVYIAICAAPLAILVPTIGSLWVGASLAYLSFVLGKQWGRMFKVSQLLGDKWLLRYIGGALAYIVINLGVHIAAFLQELVGWKERVTFDVRHFG